MRRLLDVQKKLLPDLMEVLKKRYTILQHIMISHHIGRRLLASSLNVTERVLRKEVELLKQQGLIHIGPAGMQITETGRLLLGELRPLIKQLFGLTELEEKLSANYPLKQVVVVPGDSDQSEFVKKELGREGAAILRQQVNPGDVIAVTGGSTMAEVAEGLSRSNRFRNCRFVPARGGLGEKVELQANTVASTMAKRVGAMYRLLHVPDHLSEEACQLLMQEREVREVVDLIRQARIVIHGIGEAMVMAKRRKVDHATIEQLQAEGAIAEAFSYYFDHRGEVVRNISTVGLRLEDVLQTEVVIGVAGGAEKGKAIAAFLLFEGIDILVTDEAAANVILDSIEGKVQF